MIIELELSEEQVDKIVKSELMEMIRIISTQYGDIHEADDYLSVLRDYMTPEEWDEYKEKNL